MIGLDGLTHKRMKMLAAELETPLATLVEQACKTLLDQYATLGRPRRPERPQILPERSRGY
jgi:hypothetical protein